MKDLSDWDFDKIGSGCFPTKPNGMVVKEIFTEYGYGSHPLESGLRTTPMIPFQRFSFYDNNRKRILTSVVGLN